MGRVETVKIKDGDYYKTINKSDFQDGVHELFTAQDPPKNYLSLSELRRILEQSDDVEAIDALETEENARPEGPRKGAVKALEDRRAALEPPFSPLTHTEEDARRGPEEGGDNEGE